MHFSILVSGIFESSICNNTDKKRRYIVLLFRLPNNCYVDMFELNTKAKGFTSIVTSHPSFDPESLCLPTDGSETSTCQPSIFGIVYGLNCSCNVHSNQTVSFQDDESISGAHISAPRNEFIFSDNRVYETNWKLKFSFPVHLKYSAATNLGRNSNASLSLPLVYLVSDFDINLDENQKLDQSQKDVDDILHDNDKDRVCGGLCAMCDDGSSCLAQDEGCLTQDEVTVWSAIRSFHQIPFSTNVKQLNTSQLSIMSIHNSFNSNHHLIDLAESLESSTILISMPVGNLAHLQFVDLVRNWLSIIGCCLLLLFILFKRPL